MKTTKATSELADILKSIHQLQVVGESEVVKGLRAKAHEIIINSHVSYSEAYSLFRTYSHTDKEFNDIMWRIRKTILANERR